ncbi:unnamed protein product [Calypogeia fissa]
MEQAEMWKSRGASYPSSVRPHFRNPVPEPGGALEFGHRKVSVSYSAGPKQGESGCAGTNSRSPLLFPPETRRKVAASDLSTTRRYGRIARLSARLNTADSMYAVILINQVR